MSNAALRLAYLCNAGMTFLAGGRDGQEAIFFDNRKTLIGRPSPKAISMCTVPSGRSTDSFYEILGPA